jgi:hypothetical protein
MVYTRANNINLERDNQLLPNASLENKYGIVRSLYVAISNASLFLELQSGDF